MASKSNETSHHVQIPHTHVTTEAVTTAHLATCIGVSNALLCAMYDVVNFTRLQLVKYTINGVTEQVVALNKSFAVT